MKNLRSSLSESVFSHIYVEKKALHHEETKRILARFSNRQIIWIDHYKDIFNRRQQSFQQQKQAPALILALQEGEFLYPGAPVCQDFDNHYFHYTSTVMNCIYDCEYCYLQGMYPSGHIVVFVNIEDYFQRLAEMLRIHPVYLCISYDTDLLALEGLLGHVGKWQAFAAAHENLVIELRTKCANVTALTGLTPLNNFILAFTLSPDEAIQRFEHRTPSLAKRLSALHQAAALGHPLRLCFDPLLWEPDWQEAYRVLIAKVFTVLSPTQVKDVSIGVFRISKDYLKAMRKARPASVILHYPYENDKGYYHYGNQRSAVMTNYVKQLLLPHFTEEQLFIWAEQENNE